MPNYEMKYAVADVAKIFQVEKKVVKDWAYYFSDYLNPLANPPKGTERIFSIEDIRILAYVFYYWDDKPDIENIKMELNSNNHFDNELIDNLMIEITPFFINPPDNIDETWKHGVLFSGLAQYADTFYLANSYKLAGDKLIDVALKDEMNWELFCPAVYSYRHATELYMKAITGCYKQSHNLNSLFEKLQELLQSEYSTPIPDWVKNIISTFDDFDPGGTTFRYGGSLNKEDVFIDFVQLKTLMGWMTQSFHNIRKHQGMWGEF